MNSYKNVNLFSGGILEFRLLLVISILYLPSNAQPFFDILQLYKYQSPFNDLFQNQGGQISSASFRANSVVKLGDHRLLPGIAGESTDAQQEITKDYIRFYSVELPLTFLFSHRDPKHKTAFVFVQGLNGQFNPLVLENHYQAGGAILHTIEKRSGLKYKFGLYYNAEFFGPFILPLAGIDWNVNSRLNVFGVLPNSMNIEYKFSNYIRGGIALKTFTNSYRIKNDADVFLKFQDNHLKIFCDLYISKNMVFSLEGGHSVLRKLRLGEKENDHIRYDSFNSHNNRVFRAGLIYRIRLDG